MIPAERTLENALRSVRFTTPLRVTKKTNRPSSKALVTRIEASFSPSPICTTLMIGLPRAVRLAAGISCTLSQ